MNTTEKSMKKKGVVDSLFKRIFGVPVQGSTFETKKEELNAQAISASGRSALGRATMSTETNCPYCNSTDFVKRGIRQKKHEAVQLYLCRNESCGRTFTAERVKGKRFPLQIILEGLIKGMYGSKMNADVIDEIIARYAESRTKSFHLELSWKKWGRPAADVAGSVKRNPATISI